ncbi:hypothetical protein COCOBI_19-0710 [Coccomyxa sp. Obi]|nr:hypothetical protein COCOBI_19-0710 [Coccomyxa sp. Obi]
MANKTLVIALDYSKDSVKALDFALEHFPKGYTYHLVHVVPRPHGFELLANESTDLEKDMRAAGVKYMQDLYLPKARLAGAEALVEVVEAKGDNSKQIGAAICEYAEKANADALVLMRQTKSPVTRIFMGSVTHYCAVHSPIPVIIVPNYP